MTTALNATYTTDIDGTLRITHTACGHTQVIPPVRTFDDGTCSYSSDIDVCLNCGSPLNF